jgi:dihydropyrimidinase
MEGISVFEQPDISITGGRVITPTGMIEDGGITITGEIISQVDTSVNITAGRRQVDAAGAYIIPGLIEPHAHLGLSSTEGARNLEKWRMDFRTETEGAIHGGVTTVLSHWTGSEDYVATMDTLIGWGESESYIDFNFHPVIGLDAHIAQIPELVARGVASFKHYNLVYNNDRGRQLGIYPCDDELLYRSFEAIRDAGPHAVAMVHAEDGPIINYLTEKIKASGRSDLEAWTLSRPALVENIRIRRVIDIAESLNTALYLVHVTTKEGVAMVREAKQRGVRIWAETQPCFLTHTARDEQWIGAWGKINPALKYDDDKAALWAGIRAGAVTCIGDDHLDYSKSDKQPHGVDRFNEIWACNAGMPGGMQHLLPVMITFGVLPGRITMNELVDVCATNTAKVMGLYPRKGVLQVGSDADVVIVDPTTSRVVDEDFYRTHVKDWSLYWGERLFGIPRFVTVRGRTVLDNFETAASPGRAKFVPAWAR